MTPERRKLARELLAQVKAQTWDAADPERFDAESDLFVAFIAAAPELLASALDEIDLLEQLLIELACQDPPRGVATGAVRLGPTDAEIDEQAGGRVRRRRRKR
jgi:hypothetical protein